MNEIQIIQKQLATERTHFAEVTDACARALSAGPPTVPTDWTTACTDYFALAVTRLDPADALARQLESGLSVEFLNAFMEMSRRHFQKLDEMLTRNLPVTEWRALSRIDADSIYAERARYSRVKATIPP